MNNENPTRCWIHPSLKEELGEWQKIINGIAEKETNYPVQYLEGLPLSSKMCATILRKTRRNLRKKDFIITKDEKGKLNVELLLGNELGDDKNLNLKLSKIKGIKKNEINFW